MARRTPKRIEESINLLRWLRWQVLRRSRKYRQKLAVILRDWRKIARGNGEYGRRQAAVAALRAYLCLLTGKSIVGPFLVGGKPVLRKQRLNTAQPISDLDLEEMMMVVEEAEHHRFFTKATRGRSLVEVLRSREREDGLPELVEFSRTWGLRFPIPPSLESIPEEVMVGLWDRPVQIKRGRETLVLHVYPQAGREMTLAFIEGALWHYLPKIRNTSRIQKRRTIVSRKPVGELKEILAIERSRKGSIRISIRLKNGKVSAHKRDVLRALRQHLAVRSAASFRDRENYETVFRAVDLRKRGLSRSPVAQELWPHRQKDALHVRNLERAFVALAKTFRIPL